MSETPHRPGPRARSTAILQMVRGLLHLVAVVAVTAWGFMDWKLPFPGTLVGLAALAVSVLVWALFLSPKPVLHTDRFGQALIELLLFAGATAALLALNVPWAIAAALGLAGAAVGYVVSMRTR